MATAKKDVVKQAEALFDKSKSSAAAEKVTSHYQTLLAQRAELEARIAAVREAEVAGVMEQIRQLVDEYDLHDQVQFTRARAIGPRGPGALRGPVGAKYRNPQTGQTWSGRGRAPAWIEGKDRTQFLID
ncbi:H-NS histone family protein [Paraburkholderia bannensis]|uniref:H-NS histone family protein n=1 Tax=Paraburkholderia bannensis TaxID=765414 RepID=UPI0009FB993B|nr:H-NS histone family protein [Paraburkholderia bannensis]